MARIQVLPLPTQKLGDHEHTPFVLILDGFAGEAYGVISDQLIDYLRTQTGAACVLVLDGTQMDAPGALELSDEDRNALIERLTVSADA